MLGCNRGAAELALYRISASGLALASGLAFAAPVMARDKGPELSPLECPIEGAVQRYSVCVPPFRETQDYVVKVKAIYTKLAGESGYLAVLD